MAYSAKSDDIGTITEFINKKDITIVTTGTPTTVNHQIKLTIGYESNMQTSFEDIRFNTKVGEYIDYWIESHTPSSTATVWIEIPDAIIDRDTIMMYYGNVNLNDGGNGDDTFEFFDAFEDYWIKDPANPVIEHSTGGNDEDNYQLYRSEIIDDGTDYRMYYTANQAVIHTDQVFTATSVKSNNFKNWTKHTVSGDVTPILAVGSSGQWDDDNCYLESVIKENASSYKMWYIGDDGSVGPHFLRVGYATSSDGVNWTKHGSNPIYTNTSVSANGVNYFAVWKENDSQYYAALGHYQVDRVDILTSTDGLSWSTLTSNVITDIQPSNLKKIDGVYYIYGASKNGYASTKCYSATSISGAWIDRGIQITAIGSGWEQRCYHPSLFEISTGEYLLSYSGWDGSIRPEVGIATLSSSVPYTNLNSSKWTKHASANMVISDGTMETWADGGYYVTSNDSFDMSNILEIKTSRTDNDDGIAWGYGRIWIDSTDQVKFRYYTSKIARLKNGATWHNADLAWTDAPEITGIRVSSGTAYFYEDRSLLDSFTHAAVPSGSLPVVFDTTGNQHVGADWVLIRKYITNEPTASYGMQQPRYTSRSIEFKVIIQRDDTEKDKYYPKLLSAYTNSTFPWSCPTATIELNTNVSTGTAGYMSPVQVDDIIRLQVNVRTTLDEKSVWQDIFEGRIMKIESQFGRDNPTTVYCRGHGEEILYRAITGIETKTTDTTGTMLDSFTGSYLSRLTDASPSLIDTAGSTAIADYNINPDTKYMVDVVRQFESLESYGYIFLVVPTYDSSGDLSAAYVSWQAVPATVSEQVQIREGTPRLIDATFSYSIEQLVEDVTVYGEQGATQKVGNSLDGSPAYGLRYHVETDLTLATDQLCSDLADAIRAQYNGMEIGNAKILGDPNIKVGDLIYCRIPSIELNGSTIDGNYRCRRVSHQISTENWFTYVDLGELDISTWDFIAGFQVKSRLENANLIG